MHVGLLVFTRESQAAEAFFCLYTIKDRCLYKDTDLESMNNQRKLKI